MRKLRLLLALLFVSGCGGGGGSSPSSGTAAPTPGIVFVSGSPASGATITVDACKGTCTSSLTTTYRVTLGQPLAGAALYVQYFNAAQILCGFDFTDPQDLAANQSTTFTSKFLVLGNGGNVPLCAYPATTSRIHVSLLGPFGVNGQRFLEADFAQQYTFVGPEIAAGGPAPTPAPTPRPAPAPTPESNGTCNGVVAPNSCQVGSGQPPASARCNDGKWSCSNNRQGTCSSNGGVACWVCPGRLCS